MRWLLLPLFLIRLGFAVTPTIIQLGIEQLRPYSALCFSIGILIIALISFFSHYSPTPSAANDENRLINQEKMSLLGELKQQPTHRDLLLNLSKIETYLGNEEQAKQYSHQALVLDPNNPIIRQ